MPVALFKIIESRKLLHPIRHTDAGSILHLQIFLKAIIARRTLYRTLVSLPELDQQKKKRKIKIPQFFFGTCTYYLLFRYFKTEFPFNAVFSVLKSIETTDYRSSM